MKCKDCVETKTIVAGFTTLDCGFLGAHNAVIPNTPVYVYIQRQGIPEYTVRYAVTSAASTAKVSITVASADRDFFSDNLCFTMWMTLQTDVAGDKQTFNIPNGGSNDDVTCVRLNFVRTVDAAGDLVSIATQRVEAIA